MKSIHLDATDGLFLPEHNLTLVVALCLHLSHILARHFSHRSKPDRVDRLLSCSRGCGAGGRCVTRQMPNSSKPKRSICRRLGAAGSFCFCAQYQSAVFFSLNHQFWASTDQFEPKSSVFSTGNAA
jgi:hypothetical protein